MRSGLQAWISWCFCFRVSHRPGSRCCSGLGSDRKACLGRGLLPGSLGIQSPRLGWTAQVPRWLLARSSLMAWPLGLPVVHSTAASSEQSRHKAEREGQPARRKSLLRARVITHCLVILFIRTKPPAAHTPGEGPGEGVDTRRRTTVATSELPVQVSSQLSFLTCEVRGW